jgi:hypothetical protein
MRERIKGFIVFVIAVVALFGLLKALNWVPGALQEGFPSAYDSIEEVTAKLHIRDISVPTYYPQGLRWPPSRITAQSKPYTMVLMEFQRKEDNRVSLVISQTALSHPAPDPGVELIRTMESVRYPFKGRNALLEVGQCRNNEQCSRISWSEPPYRVDIIMLSPPSEIVKIADSMVSEHDPNERAK